MLVVAHKFGLVVLELAFHFFHRDVKGCQGRFVARGALQSPLRGFDK